MCKDKILSLLNNVLKLYKSCQVNNFMTDLNASEFDCLLESAVGNTNSVINKSEERC